MTSYVALMDGTAGSWGATFPDAPGCTAMGADTSELHSNAVAALREWMADRLNDGLDMPVAREVGDLLEEADGRPIFLVPLLLDEGRTVRANISIDAGLLDQIDATAKMSGTTRSAFLAAAAREKIAEQR